MTARGAEQLVETYGPWTLGLIPLCPPKVAHLHNGDLCTHPGKVPRVPEWQKLAGQRQARGDTPERVASELARHSSLGGNIGLAMPPGVIALDADDEGSAAQLARALPDAPLQRTAHGAHFVARLPLGVEHRNTVKLELEPGLLVDLRGHRAQIVVWPSTHASGAAYVWKHALPRSVAELPELPARWAENVRRMSAIASSRPSCATGGVIPEGKRNDQLFRHARGLRRRGLHEESTLAALRVENKLRCVPPIEDGELEHLVAHAYQLPDTEEFTRRSA